LSIFVNESVENPQLREAATRYAQCYERPRANINEKTKN